MLMEAHFSQIEYRIRLDWGRRGAHAAALRSDIIVIVDVLSFSSAVITAVARGAEVLPCVDRDDALRLAARLGGEAAVGRQDVPDRGRYSLSPLTYLSVAPGTRIALPSPNGGACCRLAAGAPFVAIGGLLNARRVAAWLSALMERTGKPTTIVACGERWTDPGEDGVLRFAVEDYLGAGAILAGLRGRKSPEARVCSEGFGTTGRDVLNLMLESGSGRELRARGFERDVQHSAKLDSLPIVPFLNGEVLQMEPKDGRGLEPTITTVIFACVHNAGRSQMASAFFNAACDPRRARSESAGTEPAERVHPEVVRNMEEVGIDLSECVPRRLTRETVSQAQLLITLGCGESCPMISGLATEDWPVADPKGQPMDRVREIREDIRTRVNQLVESNGWSRATTSL